MRWDHTEYGETWAEIYDDVFAWVDDTEPSVRKIAQIAGENGVLELGAGTGRVAVPLARALEPRDRSPRPARGTGIRARPARSASRSLRAARGS